MATDPIRRIRNRTYESDLELNLADPLIRLAGLPPSMDAPYVTVSLDWRPDFTAPGRQSPADGRRSQRRAQRGDPSVSQRPSRQYFERTSGEFLASIGPRGDAFESVQADIARVLAFLDNTLDPSAQGVFIVACAAMDVFEPLALGLPVPNSFLAAPTPTLSTLTRLNEDHPTYAVLVADQRDARLTFITQATRDHGVYLESSLYPRKQHQGGWSQRRFQARADERVFHFARGIARELQTALEETGVDLLVVAGDEVITSALASEWSPAVEDHVVATIRLDIGATPQDIIAATLPLVAEAERSREERAVQSLREILGSGRAVAGAVDVLAALQASQVGLLLLTEDFTATGWADYHLGMAGVDPIPAEHPVGGAPANMVEIRLEEEFVRLGLQTGAEIEIVHTSVPVSTELGADLPAAGSAPPRSAAATALHDVGGVGALLRFALNEG